MNRILEKKLLVTSTLFSLAVHRILLNWKRIKSNFSSVTATGSQATLINRYAIARSEFVLVKFKYS